MAPVSNSNESYCTFTLASDVTAGGLPSEAEIAKDLESNDDNVRLFYSQIVTVCLELCIHTAIGRFHGFRLSHRQYCGAVESYGQTFSDIICADTIMPDT
jgi:hypothetical protein